SASLRPHMEYPMREERAHGDWLWRSLRYQPPLRCGNGRSRRGGPASRSPSRGHQRSARRDRFTMLHHVSIILFWMVVGQSGPGESRMDGSRGGGILGVIFELIGARESAPSSRETLSTDEAAADRYFAGVRARELA